MLHLTASSKYNKTPLSIMTQILSRFFRGILFQLWFTLCSQKQRVETQNGMQLILHPHRARLNIHKDGRGTQELFSLAVFYVGWFFGSWLLLWSRSYCNDPLPAPAVNLLAFTWKKQAKPKPPAEWQKPFPFVYDCHQQHRGSESSSTSHHLSWPFTIKRWLIYSILNPSLLSLHITNTLLTLKEAQGNSPRCTLAMSLHCHQCVQPQGHPKTLHIASAEADPTPERSDAVLTGDGSASDHWHLQHACCTRVPGSLKILWYK